MEIGTNINRVECRASLNKKIPTTEYCTNINRVECRG